MQQKRLRNGRKTKANPNSLFHPHKRKFLSFCVISFQHYEIIVQSNLSKSTGGWVGKCRFIVNEVQIISKFCMIFLGTQKS